MRNLGNFRLALATHQNGKKRFICLRGCKICNKVVCVKHPGLNKIDMLLVANTLDYL